MQSITQINQKIKERFLSFVPIILRTTPVYLYGWSESCDLKSKSCLFQSMAKGIPLRQVYADVTFKFLYYVAFIAPFFVVEQHYNQT